METVAAPVDSQTELTTALVNQLNAQANTLVGAINKVSLDPIDMGSAGLFPYYWQDPSNLNFNSKTYDWVKRFLVQPNEDSPVGFGSVFHDQFLTAINAISYSLSNADQVALNQANANTVNQQGAVLNAWVAAYGKLPTPTTTTQPIDDVVNIIRTTWATDTKTTLQDLQSSKNINLLLGNMPASGKPILPVFVNYLNAMGSALGLIDTVSYKTGYIERLIEAVSTPSATNGGMLLNNGKYAPAYVFSQQASDIINGLKNLSNSVKLNTSMKKYSETDVEVSVGAKSYIALSNWFFSLDVENDTNYYQQNIVSNSQTISIEMDFTGVTIAQYTPLQYDDATGLGWFDASPILESLKNGSSDVSGYKFQPNPEINFEEFGNFGLSTAVAIANYPTITIVITSDDYQSIYSRLDTSTNFAVSSMCNGGVSGSTSYSKSSLQQDDTSKSITITMSPPQNLVAGTAVGSTAFVMGIHTEYPASN